MSEEKTILLIEADESIKDEIKDALADKPIRYVEVDQASDAVMQLAVEGPDAAIVALELPDGGGTELLQNIRDFDTKIPLVVIMGEPTKEKIVAAKRARAVDILLKPPDYDRLAKRLSNSLWLDPSLIKKDEDELDFEAELKKHKTEMEKEEAERPKEEAMPKGAEMVNVNDLLPGMKIAKTLIFNDVVYGDKGQVLTDKEIKQFSRMGVEEACVYVDKQLKKKLEEKKKQQAQAKSIKTDSSGVAVGAGSAPGKPQEFAKVKRSSVRVDVETPVEIKTKNEEGEEETIDGLTADCSAGGCAILTAMPLKKGEEITMNFELDEGRFKMQNVKGLVRHSMRRFGTDDYPFRSGIFFTNITERYRENLITVLFKLERENKKKEDEMRARYGYGPKRRRKR